MCWQALLHRISHRDFLNGKQRFSVFIFTEFNIVCEHPQPICNFIIHELNRSATTFEARGAYSDAHKTVIMTTMRRSQAIRLRNFIRQQEPTAFIMIENSSEIIGKGFSPV